MVQTKEKNLYGSWRIYAPDGQLLSLTSEKRARWYIVRGLGSFPDKSKKEVFLLFEPRGRDTDSYMLLQKHNRCVVCGSTEIKVLTKHHVIPSMYRKLFPHKLKEHSSHDVLVICRSCHDLCERQYADALKEKLAIEYDAPLQIELKDDTTLRAIMIARTLINKWDQLPGARVEELLYSFEDITGIDPNNFEDLYNYIDTNKDANDNFVKSKHPNIVVDSLLATKNLNAINQFAIRWRTDFLKNMNPKYMPDGWQVDRLLGINSF